MLTFFRNIRRRLAADNQFFKYSRYAIGEIILVVIGILIALYINNWNEERKNKERTLILFEEIQRDLLNSHFEIQNAIDRYNRQQRMINHILADSVSEENIRDYFMTTPIMGLPVIQITSNGFDKLNNSISNMPDEYQELFGLLIQLYQGLDFVLEKQALLETKMRDNHDRISFTQSWYSKDWESEEAIKYFLHDPFYRNLVSQFSLYLDDFNLMENIDHIDKMYIYLSDLTGINQLPDQFQHHKDQELKEFEGTYQWLDSIQKMELGDRKITADWDHINYTGNNPFYEYEKDSFVSYYNNSILFKRNAEGEITGAVRYFNGQVLHLEKME